MYLVCKSIGGILSKKGRVPVEFDSKKYSLSIDKIRKVLWDGQRFYVDYDVNGKTAEFYEQFKGQPPENAVEVKLVKEEKWLGERCDCGKYWDIDTIAEYEHANGFCECPRCGKVLSGRKVTKVRVEWDLDALVNKTAEVIAKENGFKTAKPIGKYWSNVSGGTYPVFDRVLKEQKMKYPFDGYVISEGIKIQETHYDSDRIQVHYESKEPHLVIYTDTGVETQTGMFKYVFQLS